MGGELAAGELERRLQVMSQQAAPKVEVDPPAERKLNLTLNGVHHRLSASQARSVAAMLEAAADQIDPQVLSRRDA